MAVKNVKQALITGVGELYLQFMDTEDNSSTAPVYNTEVLVTPSVDKIQVALELSEKKVYGSNLLHTDLSAVKSATITLDALYLPTEFVNKAQGMVAIDGGYSMPTNPQKKYFRLAVPITNHLGEAYVINFPKCSLSPVDINGETEREEISEQLQQFNILGMPLVYKTDANHFVYHTLDLAITENGTKYDLTKLLEKGWYDTATLKACEKSAG